MFPRAEAALKGCVVDPPGANIGAAKATLAPAASADDIEARCRRRSRAGATLDGRVPRGTVPSGEARFIHVGGGRYVSMLGKRSLLPQPAGPLWPTASTSTPSLSMRMRPRNSR